MVIVSFVLTTFSQMFFVRATFRVFKMERKLHGKEDLAFLERVFQKLLLNFTWLVSSIVDCISKLTKQGG